MSLSVLNPLSKHSQFTLHTPLPTTTEYVDPFIAVKEMLWLLPGINGIVSSTLDRMEKAFAYNSVYLLKIILDLQSQYLPLRPVSPEAMLSEHGIIRIACVLSGRLAKKDSDAASLSRELQLRTLISALSLLHQLNSGNLDSDSHTKLLRNLTERDSHNEAKREQGGPDSFRAGENEFLTRYGCDLVKCLQAELPIPKELNREAIHFLFAAGFINQLEAQPSKQMIAAVFARVSAPPTHWFEDMRGLYESAVDAILLHHQERSSNLRQGPSLQAAIRASAVAQTIIERLELQLAAFDENRGNDENNWGAADGSHIGLSKLDVQIFTCGLLDLLSQLVATFPGSEDIVLGARALALRLIRTSGEKAFRYKGFEIVICSTLGVGEKEYYDTMRNLEFEIEMTSAPDVLDARSMEEKLEWVQQLKLEKREAMDRCEKKNVLSTGAAESIQRRLQANTVPQMQASPGEIAQIAARSIEDVRTASPVPSSLPSQVPTLFSTEGQSWESVSSDSPTSTPTYEPLTISPSTIRSSEFPFPSAINTHNIVLSPVSPSSCSPKESPIIQIYTPTIPRRLPTASPEPENTDPYLHRELSQLFSSSISLFDEPEDSEGQITPITPTRNASLNPTRKPVPVSRPSYYSAQDLPFTNKHNQSDQTVGSFQSDTLADQSSHSSGSAHSLSRMASAQTKSTSSRRPVARRAWSLQIDKSLPPVADGVEPSEMRKKAAAAENAPELAEIQLPISDQFQNTLGTNVETSNYDSLYGFHTLQQSQFGGGGDGRGSSPLPPIADICVESVTEHPGPVADYDKPAVETMYKFHSKDSCFSTCISADGKHAVFLSPHSFQVFAIPTPEQGPASTLKPKFHYRLGDWEGLKKGKVRWQYIAAAVSDSYVVTITKERLQVHDLAADNHVIYNDTIKGWEYSAVSISSTVLIVGLSKPLKSEAIGMLRLYRQNAHSYDGHRYECVGKDIHLPIHPRQPQDSPHILTLSKDGRHVACATPRFGYYFVWNISRPHEPQHLATSKTSGEHLTSVTLLPDARHLLVSTLPANFTPNSNSTKHRSAAAAEDALAAAGAFTEAMYASPLSGTASQRPLSLLPPRIFHAAVSPSGDAAAVLGRNGTVWVTPLVWLDGDDNLTELPPARSDARLLDPQAGKVAFTPDGRRIVAVDRRGRCLVLTFVERAGRAGGAEGMAGSSMW
ncbi:hypothetical protein BZA05DRAFT_335629 [Tricharina praecox]|uniref:uncharacterized protein n=1 Tax=Tricharina praecox TaxID=43433 RepID=UPI00221E583F|nr:uncharacterized protein BZA05DRAFT_335629 [Tricharina praecox]KAI5854379.1 hypothetical protein BZA05DRAFT_335629 [Tricharina praecox]